MTYQILAGFAQTGGLLYFVALFAGVAIYAFWPCIRSRFDEAARMPLAED
jgi:cytochrome c oxidase cbb3-type subunit IV